MLEVIEIGKSHKVIESYDSYTKREKLAIRLGFKKRNIVEVIVIGFKEVRDDGLERRHWHPVPSDIAREFYVGAKMEGYINRGFFSHPIYPSQVKEKPSLIDGKLTYFATWLSSVPKPDIDRRDDPNANRLDLVDKEFIFF